MVCEWYDMQHTQQIAWIDGNVVQHTYKEKEIGIDVEEGRPVDRHDSE